MTLSLWNLTASRLLSISPSEVHFATRGFRPVSNVAGDHLENIGRSFLTGYHEALQEPDAETLCSRLATIDVDKRGFAFEGAAMATWLLDSLSMFHRSRWSEFLNAPTNIHPYVVYVGVGWAIARLPWARRDPERFLSRLDPLLRWLIIDGYGFHEGYFHTSQWIHTTHKRPNISAYARRVFDQGLGRSLWFVEGSDVLQIADTIAKFEPSRRADLWSGIGLACAYAGRASVLELECLRTSAGVHLGHLQQGITFGAEARVRGEIAAEFTEHACMTICKMDAVSAANLTRTVRTDVERLPDLRHLPQYEQWRSRIRESLSEMGSVCPSK